jgi:hypothetical protein
MNEVAVKPETRPEALEVKALARQLASAYWDRVNRYKHELGLSTQGAVAKAEEPCSLSRLWKIQDRPSEELTWGDLEESVGKTGGRALDRWEEIKGEALEELRSGHRAGAVVLGRHSGPFDLARFLAIRAELAVGWQPRNGVERQLIDVMAQAQAGLFFWQERLYDRAAVDLPDVAEQAGAMVERFNRMFLRTLRALQDLRRYTTPVIVQNAGQVNVGGQQVNMAAVPK